MTLAGKLSDLLGSTSHPSEREELDRKEAEHLLTLDAIPARLADCDAQEAIYESEGNKDGWVRARLARDGVLFDKRAALRGLKSAQDEKKKIDDARRWAKLPSAKDKAKTLGAAYSKAYYASNAAANAYMDARQALISEFPELAAATSDLPVVLPLAFDMGAMSGPQARIVPPLAMLDFAPNLHKALASITKKAG